MAPPPTTQSAPTEQDPIADARALIAMVVGLGQRARTAHHLSAVTDRKASLYISTLVRHAARLLQSSLTHDVPTLNASGNSPGGNSTHYVLRHDRLGGPPAAIRLLLVGSDARLRCCVISESGGARIWADYDVGSAPADLSMRTVMEALSTLIGRLEKAVTRLESTALTRELQLDADIAASKARVAGLSATIPTLGKRQLATSEEPIRPWTRHAGKPVGNTTTALADVSADAVADVAQHAIASEPSAGEAAASAAATVPDARSAAADAQATPDSSFAPKPAEQPRPVEESSPPARRSVRLSRLGNAI